MKKELQHNILVLAVAAFAFRLIFILMFPGPNYFEGISASYLEVAENVLQGRGIVTYADIAPLSSPTSHWSYETFIDRPLGYLFLVLVPYAIVSSPFVIQLLHALLASLTVTALYRVGWLIVSEQAAWRAALLYSVWPLSARFEIAILPDAVMPFFLVLTLWLLIRGVNEPERPKWYLLSGIACGIGMTIRPDVLLLPIFFVAALLALRVAQKPLRASFLLLLGAVVILGAHTIRNYSATDGRIVPLGLGNGISMWEGISQFGDTLGTVYGDERTAALEGYRAWAYPDGIERDGRRFSEALEIIRQHPGWYAGVMAKRIPVLLTPDWIMTRKFAPSLKEFLDSSGEHSIAQYAATYPLSFIIRLLLVLLQYGALVLAVIAVAKDARNKLLWFPVLLIFYYIVIHIPTNTEARYFYPAIPLLLLLASHGWEKLRAKRRMVTEG